MIFKFIILIMAVLSVLLTETLGKQKTLMTIESIPKFPFNFNTLFKITFVPYLPNDRIFKNSDFNSLIIRIIGDNEIEFDKQQIFYKSKSKFYHGHYFTIWSWERNIKENYIELSLLFPRLANNKYLEIYEISAGSVKEYLEIKKRFKSSSLLYKSKINLSFSSEVELSLKPAYKKSNIFISGQTVTVKCQTSKNSIQSKPNILNLNEFTVESELYSKTNYDILVKIKLTSSDHGKILKCQGGKQIEMFKIKVIHPPSKVNITPMFKSIIKVNANITCSHGNGYPIPNTFWTFVKGPNISPSIYSIDKDKRILKFNKNPSSNLEWVFNCSAQNNLTTLNGIYHKNVKFLSEGDKIIIEDMDNIETLIDIKSSKLKKYIDAQLIHGENILKNFTNENEKLKQTNIKLLNEIFMIKSKLQNNSAEVIRQQGYVKNEINKLHSTFKKQEKQIEDLNSQISENKGFEITVNEFQKLKDDVIKQNDDISGLKLKTETMKMESNFQQISITKMNKEIKSFVQFKESLINEMKFIKSNLFWEVPIRWSVTNIEIEREEKKEASSDSFYTQIKNYKLNLYASFTADKIEFFVYLQDTRRNVFNGLPFRSEITIRVINRLHPTIYIERKLISTINKAPGISESISFNRKELDVQRYLIGNTIEIICDVNEF